MKAQVDAWVAAVVRHIGHETITLNPCSDEDIAALPPVNPLRTLAEIIGGRD